MTGPAVRCVTTKLYRAKMEIFLEIVAAFNEAAIYPDLIVGAAFFLVWLLIPALYLFDVNIVLIVLITAILPVAGALFLPEIFNVVLLNSYALLMVLVILIEISRYLLRKQFPVNENVDLSRFDLSMQEQEAYVNYMTDQEQYDREKREILEQDLPKNKDGSYSERSRAGKAANAKLRELRGRHTRLLLKKYELLERVGDFTFYRQLYRGAGRVLSLAIFISISSGLILNQLYPDLGLKIVALTSLISLPVMQPILFVAQANWILGDEDDLFSIVLDRYYQQYFVGES